MSGHSKWSQIKRKKQATDMARGNTFTKLSKIITLAVIEGGKISDPENNFKLRLAIEKAKGLNMPKENIKRAIEHGASSNTQQFKEVVYEGFAPHGVALIIIATSDNPNRTVSEIKNIVTKLGGKMGTPGSVGYLFKKCGRITFSKNSVSEDAIFEFGAKIDAFDIEQDDEAYIVYFPFENLGKINSNLGDIKVDTSEVVYKPETTITLNEEQENKIYELIDALKNQDDVQNVFVNIEDYDH